MTSYLNFVPVICEIKYALSPELLLSVCYFIIASGKETKVENWYQEWGNRDDEPDHMALKPLKLIDRRNVEEFGTWD